MSDRFVALLRGVNVGRAGRVSMADLRAMFAEAGFTGVRTLLNSGNVVFESANADSGTLARTIERLLAERLAVPVRVIVFSAEEIARAVARDPLAAIATNPSRLLVAFLADAADVSRIEPLLDRDWAPEALAVGERVAYLWCPDGVSDSEVGKAVGRALGGGVTTRSWGTVVKIHALLGG